MTIKLVQKHVVKGTREFELVEDAVNVRIDRPFLEKEFTVVFSVLDPEPVINGSDLAFVSVVNREPLLEFFIDKPNPQDFNDFVQKIKERVVEEDFGRPKSTSTGKKVNVEQVQIALDMLRTYMGDDELESLLASLEALKVDPENHARLDDMYKAFNALGPKQGAVLSYAPYISTLLSDNAGL